MVYSVEDHVREFSGKGWTVSGLNKLLRKQSIQAAVEKVFLVSRSHVLFTFQ